MGAGTAFSRQMPGKLPAFLFDVSSVSRRGMALSPYDQRDRKSEQGVQAQNEAYGDRGRGKVLLYPPGLRLPQNGTPLAVKAHRKGRAELAVHSKSGKL